MSGFSLNARAGVLADQLVADAALLRVGVAKGEAGETLVDCGVRHPGGLAAGLAMAAISLGGIGTVSLAASGSAPRWPWQVEVRCADPVTACLASQYAGWVLKHERPGGAYSALGSGPARALARKEPIFEELRHEERSDRALLVVEGEEPPPPAVLREVAGDCRIASERLTVLFAPTGSLAGSVQVAARIIEVALQKARALEFPLDRLVDALGSAPLSPPHPDGILAMGRSNDAIVFGGRVHLFVTGPAAAAKALAADLPSFKSRDYGAPFAEIYRKAGEDFYAIDPLLFSPAWVAVTALESGETFRAGTLAADLLDASFG